jgi:hypothetical protein
MKTNRQFPTAVHMHVIVQMKSGVILSMKNARLFPAAHLLNILSHRHAKT